MKKSNEVVIRDIKFKVKPLVRHAVTYVEDTVHADGSEGASGGTLCEVNSEEAAQQIQRALELLHAPRRYAVVQRSFEPGNCVVYYAYSKAQAEQFQETLQKFYQTDFRIYEQPLLDLEEACRHHVDSSEPQEYLMIRDGQLMMTHAKAVQVGGSVTVGDLTVTRMPGGRSVISMQLPDALTPEEASEAVTEALRKYAGADLPAKLKP